MVEFPRKLWRLGNFKPLSTLSRAKEVAKLWVQNLAQECTLLLRARRHSGLPGLSKSILIVEFRGSSIDFGHICGISQKIALAVSPRAWLVLKTNRNVSISRDITSCWLLQLNYRKFACWPKTKQKIQWPPRQKSTLISRYWISTETREFIFLIIEPH